MSLDVHCDKCGEELMEPGALVFSPPNCQTVKKWHLCVSCWRDLILFMLDEDPVDMLATPERTVIDRLADLEKLESGHAVVVPKDRSHAESMLKVAQFYLGQTHEE